MKQFLRPLSAMMAVLVVGFLSTISLLNMLYPKARTVRAVMADLKFAGAYQPLPAYTTSASAVFERANPAVVRVTATHIVRTRPDEEETALPEGHPDVDRDRRSRGIGTGCIIDQAGYIVTNQHVIDQADQIRVRLIDDTELPAQLIGSDKITDIALLKIEPPTALVVLPIGDSQQLRVGEPVVAIGNPYSYDRSVTTGIVSAKGRKVFNTLYENYIQTDAAINVGNSGGPLLNMAGELIGINTVVRADANGISFAIPSNQVKHIVTQLKRVGRVVRGFLGVQPDTINNEVRDALGLPSTAGALVTYVTADSAAAKAGLEVYDVIVKFNAQPVIDKDTLYHLIAETPPGQDVEIEFIRNGAHRRVLAQLTEREDLKVSTSLPKQKNIKKTSLGRTGFSVQDKSFATERVLRVGGNPDKLSGVVIAEIDPLSSAAEAGLQRGFIITEINRTPIKSVTDFEQMINNTKDGEVVLLRVLGDRGGNQPYFITAIRL
ncbi:MAG: trypsin-like peptidase domain-containing protein [Acidobacteriota bacterium]